MRYTQQFHEIVLACIINSLKRGDQDNKVAFAIYRFDNRGMVVEKPMDDFLQQEYLGNSVQLYLTTLGILVFGVVVIQILRVVILRWLKRWAQRTATSLDDAFIGIFERSLIPVGYLAIVYLALTNLNLSSTLQQVVQTGGVILATMLGVRFIIALAEYAIRLYWITQRYSSRSLDQSLGALIPAIRAIVWALGLVFLLDNLGFDISAVIAGLGIGGVAVALASQGILADLFSYFSILFDRPFEIGDFIIVDEFMGTVERVGIKTTRLKSLSGEELVLANTDLTSSRIRNYKRMEHRRIAFKIGVTYETGLDKLATIPNSVEQVIEGVEHAQFDRAHFFNYGDFSLDFEIVYFVTTNDYNVYMDTQQAINLGIKREFDEHGIEFAYPTQVHYLASLPGEPFAVKTNGHAEANVS